MVQTYNELRVTYDREGKKIIDKVATKRGTVRISEHTAEVNNTYVHATKLLYEVAEDKPDRAALLAEASDLGLEVPKNIKTDLLINKIKDAKE